MKRQFKAGDK